MIYDLHTHSTHSDGMLIPAEVARTAQVQGYLGIALTDHVDSSNIYQVLQANLKFKEEESLPAGVFFLPSIVDMPSFCD